MKNFNATLTALVTPFKGGAVDFPSLEKVVHHQLENGVDGFVINGTTAESPTLSEAEAAAIFTYVRKLVGAKVPLIFGTGSNSTDKTVELTKKAEDLGADGALVVVPYYNKPPQRGLIQHFLQVAKAVSLPVLLYNVPGRTITSLTVESVIELSRQKNIVGIKEATGNIELAAEIRKKAPADFTLLSGDDGTYVDFLKAGGDGVISVASHVIPREMAAWKSQIAAGKASEATAGIIKHTSLINHLFVEANPIPVKMALYFMGLIQSPELRLPLVTMAEDLAQKMKIEMKSLGVI